MYTPKSSQADSAIYNTKDQTNQIDNGSEFNHSSDEEDNYELVPHQNQLLKPRPDKPLQYLSKPFIKEEIQQDSRVHHELIPRESSQKSIKSDQPASYGSKPFVFTGISKKTLNQNQQNRQSRKSSVYERANILQDPDFPPQVIIQQNFIEISQNIQKNSPPLTPQQFFRPSKKEQQKIQRQQTQKQQSSSSESSKSIVSKSSQRQENQTKQVEFRNQQWAKVHHQQGKSVSTKEIKDFGNIGGGMSKTKIQEVKETIVRFQNGIPTGEFKFNQEHEINAEIVSSHKIIKIQQEQLHKGNERSHKSTQGLPKYIYQTQKYSINTNSDKQSPKESSKKNSEQHPEESLNLMKVSPTVKDPEHYDLDISFSSLAKEQKPQVDPYEKYKKSAQSTPILEPLIENISMKKQIFQKGHKRYYSTKEQLQYELEQEPQKNYTQKKQTVILNTPSKDFVLHQTESSQQKLAKSLKEIDHLRLDLLKSTENNINAIFNTNLTGQECCMAQMVEGVHKKITDLYSKMDKIQDRRVKEIELEIQRMRLREKQIQMQREEKQRERERQAQRERQRREESYERFSRYQRGNQNVILDLGKSIENQGKIIAIYPAGKAPNIKQLMTSHKEPNSQSRSSQSEASNLKIMLEIQQNFMKTLQQFQDQVNLSIDRKISQFKSVQDGKQRQLEKFQRVSQETNDKDEEYDDSRGSINVLYLRRLREFEEQVKEKQWTIERLEKQNYQLERQLQKWEKLVIEGHNNQKKQSVQLKDSYKMSEDLALTKEYSFRKNPALDPNYQFSSSLQMSSQSQEHPGLLNFSKQSPVSPTNLSNQKSLFSSQNQEQRIKETVALTTDQLNSFNPHSKKKNTHSFHYFESKNIQANQLIQLKEKLSQYELALKQKDLRIRELENTIMDQLENSRKWKLDSSGSGKSSKISGYESVGSSESNVEVLQMKISNLKTLLKEEKKLAQKYEKLYNDEKCVNLNMVSKQSTKTEVKIGAEDLVSNTSKSICVSEKTTIRNERILGKGDSNGMNSPFAEITEQNTTIQRSRILESSSHQEGSAITQCRQSDFSSLQVVLMTLANFIMMAWSLKDVVSKLCSQEVNAQKINRNARQFLQELKSKDRRSFGKVYGKLLESVFIDVMKGVWVD